MQNDPLTDVNSLASELSSQEGSLAAAINRMADVFEAANAPAPEEEVVAFSFPSSFEELQPWLITIGEKLLSYLPALLGALAILIIGRIVARLVTKLVRKALGASRLDQTLVGFLGNMVYAAMMAFVVIAALGKLGVDTGSFVAILGAATFAIGFALQGSLSNFAAGVMIMILRPIRVGDLVEAGGVLGEVSEIGVFATIINTLENKRAIIANGTITADNIINYSANGSLRVDMTFGIGYEDDMSKAVKIMHEVLSNDQRVLSTPKPTVACSEHGDSSVNFVCRPYVKPQDYWDVWFDTHHAVKEQFDAQGISIPFPQRDVHMIPVQG